FNEPLSGVTRLLTGELYAPRPWVRYSGAVTSARGWKLRLLGWVFWLYRFQQVKVKVGIAGQNDAERLRSLRRRLGRRGDLRVDATEASHPAEVVERIKALEPAGTTAVEQPLPHEAVTALPSVRKEIRTPVMLDESLCSLVDAERAVAGGWCDLFNLRLSKVG